MNVILGLVFIFAVIVSTGAAVVVIYRRRRTARNLHPPEALKFRRGPGESLRHRMDELEDRFVNTILSGSSASVGFLGVPALILWIIPNANPYLLFGSGIALFAAGLIWITRRCAKLLDEYANLRLGRMGECVVAEALETTLAVGCHVFHDIPIEGEWGKANIDHVVVGPHGAAVVESKMRAKPADKAPRDNRVIFDGKTLAWPRCRDDSKTLWQVRKNAEWLEAYLLKECGFSFPVKQVVAIPGWNVVERVLGQPRVVRGEKAGDAVLQAIGADGEARFTRDQVKRLVAAMDALCRDVEI